MQPQNPIAAVTHPDPYPFYAELVANKPLYYDEALNLWIASSADAVNAVLTNPLCRVRPTSEPVPKALLGSPAADIFCQLVRMTDGEIHHSKKQAVSKTIGSLEPAYVLEQGRKWAKVLVGEIADDPSRIADFSFQLPVYVVGSLLGIPESDLPQVAVWMRDFVKCLSPASTPEQIELGKSAAGQLWNMVHSILPTASAESLLGRLANEAKSVGRSDTETIVANGIGFLSQAYEATAGLIGNTLVALAAHPELLERSVNDGSLLRQTILEVIRYDPPVQNTRRFVAQDGMIAGQPMKAGDAILVVLAAANRDPQANPQPAVFDPNRKDRQSFTFGVGVHACPGEILATSIAQAGVENILASGIDLRQLTAAYYPSANVRIPLFERAA